MANSASFRRPNLSGDEPKAATWQSFRRAKSRTRRTGKRRSRRLTDSSTPDIRQLEAPRTIPAEPDADEKAAELLEKFTAAKKVKRQRRPKYLRRILLMLGPIVVLAGGLYAYLAGGRYVATDDAYVHAGKLTIATDVSGIVSRIDVHESQAVEKGQVLFTFDEEPFRIALAGAEANRGAVRNQIVTQQANYRQKLTMVDQAKTDIELVETTYQRQKDLLQRGVACPGGFRSGQARSRGCARARFRGATRRRGRLGAAWRLGGRQSGGQSDVSRRPGPGRQGQARSQAYDRRGADRRHCHQCRQLAGRLLSDGLPRCFQPGFPSSDVWVEANPKEFDLTYLKAGDKAAITIDSYPGREWTATVSSLSPATGAEFSVLPAQNSSGNWVKVVQRVPIRLQVDVPPARRRCAPA